MYSDNTYIYLRHISLKMLVYVYGWVKFGTYLKKITLADQNNKIMDNRNFCAIIVVDIKLS